MDFNLNLPTSDVQLIVPENPKHKPRTLLTHVSGNDYLLVLDNTAAEKFTTCPQSAWNYLVLRREGHAKSAALTFGGAIHEGLDEYLNWQFNVKRDPTLATPEMVTAMLNRASQRILTYFTENPTPPDEYRTPLCAVEVLKHYASRSVLPDYDWDILSHEGKPCVERPFEIPLGTLRVNAEIVLPEWEGSRYVERIYVAWSGRIDAVADCNGKHRIVDHKTTSVGTDSFIQDFQLSNQTQGYVWAARKLYPELDVQGFCANVIFLKKPGVGQGLTQSGPRGGVPPLNFFRSYFDYSDSRLEQWEKNALTLCEDFVACLVRNFAPMHTKWCFGKYGRCPYHDACTIDDEAVRGRFLASDAFKSVTWNPTNDR